MTWTIEFAVRTFNCEKCGGTCGIASDFYRRWEAGDLDSARTITCPYCGHRWTCGYTRVKELEKQLAAERARLDQAKAAIAAQREGIERRDRRIAATRGVVTRIRNRVFNGVCPCCSERFRNVEAHIKSKHPDWKGHEEPK